MCPRVPEEISSARRQLTAATSSSELPSETPVFPQTAKWAGRLSTISYCKFCCLLLLPHLISSCSKERDYYLSTVKRGHWKRQRVHHRANTNQGMQKKLISLQLLLCTKPCFRMNPPVHRSVFFSQQLAADPFSLTLGRKARTYWCSSLWGKWCSAAESQWEISAGAGCGTAFPAPHQTWRTPALQ